MPRKNTAYDKKLKDLCVAHKDLMKARQEQFCKPDKSQIILDFYEVKIDEIRRETMGVLDLRFGNGPKKNVSHNEPIKPDQPDKRERKEVV